MNNWCDFSFQNMRVISDFDFMWPKGTKLFLMFLSVRSQLLAYIWIKVVINALVIKWIAAFWNLLLSRIDPSPSLNDDSVTFWHFRHNMSSLVKSQLGLRAWSMMVEIAGILCQADLWNLLQDSLSSVG